MCQTDVCPVSSYNTVKQQQNVYRRFMVLPTDNFFVCALVCTCAHTHTHTHTHTLVLARRTGYCWKCYLTGYSIVYLLVWESGYPQLCLVAYITCLQNSWSSYFVCTVLLRPLGYSRSWPQHLDFGYCPNISELYKTI